MPSTASAGRGKDLPRSRLAGRIQSIVQRRFGLKRLRHGQQEVITRVLRGEATLAIMPTGAGKSLCYQVPALMLDGRTVVISPLIALMKDQCEALQQRGIAAVQVNSALDAQALQDAEAAVADGSARIVLTTPERLADPGFVALLQKHPVSLAVVDEAHCISQWGHDFRPAFLEIAPALAKLGKPVVLALTATATEAVSEDVMAQLGIPGTGVVNTGAYRANLQFRVEQVAREEDKLARVLALARDSAGAGLVYTATVKAAEAVHDALRGAGESVACYHGKLGPAQREAAQEDFMQGRARLMVATNAFGLGIDKPDIRFVLHYQMTPGLDAYYQEAGRAGRDGSAADCTLLFLRKDKAVQQFFMGGRYPDAQDVLALCRTLQREPGDAETGWSLPAMKAVLDLPLNKLRVAISLLRRQGIASLDEGGQVHLRKAPIDEPVLQEIVQAYGSRRAQDRAALEGMVFYAQTGQCRWQVLLAHLEDKDQAFHCGQCDNCRRIAALQAELAAGVALPAPGQGNGQPAGPGSPAACFRPGDAVQVRRYGRGRVVEADALSVTVEFPGGTQRSFLAEYVQTVALRRRAGLLGEAGLRPRRMDARSY